MLYCIHYITNVLVSMANNSLPLLISAELFKNLEDCCDAVRISLLLLSVGFIIDGDHYFLGSFNKCSCLSQGGCFIKPITYRYASW